MKTYRLLFTALAILLVGILGWHFFVATASRPTQSVVAAPSPSSAAKSTLPGGVATPTARLALPPGWQVMSVDEKIASSVGQARVQQFQQMANGENSRPLDFYGQVIDQNGEPVVGAKVLGRILLILGFDRSGGESHYAETDVHGRFQFTGIHGASLTITPQKSGYEYDSRLPTNWSPDYKPDSSHPMVFTLWKLHGAEPMLHADVDRRLPYDEQSATFGASFDLSTGKITRAGELHITLIQNPVVVKRGRDRFDWKIVLTVPGGGLIEATDLYKNLAPESGYQETYSFAQGKDNPQWASQFVKYFYVHTAKGQYTRVKIDLTPGTNRPELGFGVGLSLETWLNPSGSRNLEFDTAKEIKPSASGRTF
jgi:hypothetical protein